MIKDDTAVGQPIHACFCEIIQNTCVVPSKQMCRIGYMYVMAQHTAFLPRCMECRRGLAMRILSVCPSVC